MDVLRFDRVTKRLGWRRHLALDALSFQVTPGMICGLVGPNGAGKTTTFGIISGFLRPDEGSVHLLGGEGFEPGRLKGRLGVLPQDAELPLRHTPTEFLLHLGRLQGMSASQAKISVDEVLRRVDLGDRVEDRIASLSHGMRRRVAVASALLGSPELILLDEPLAGLDPLQSYRLRELMLELRGDHTLVVSSHDLLALEKVADEVVVLEKGRCIRSGAVDDLMEQREVSEWELFRVPRDADALLQRLAAYSPSLRGSLLGLQWIPGESAESQALEVMSVLSTFGVGVRSISRGKTLEETLISQP